jgi:integrase
MASVRKRTDGRPGYTVRWRDEAGTQRKRSFSKKALADRFRAEVENALNTGSYVDPKAAKVTFYEVAEQWRLSQPHRENTAAGTLSRLTVHAYPTLGKRPIGQIKPSELQAWVSGLPLSPSSVRPVWNTAKAVFKAAMRDRRISWDPTLGVKLPELPRVQVVPLTVAEVSAIADNIDPRYRALVMVGAGAGLRQGELFGLRVSDVDFLRRTIRVAQQVQVARGGGTRVAPLKGRASTRTIPVGTTVIDAIAAHLRDYPAGRDELVFRDEDGKALYRVAFGKNVWSPARTAAGLPETTCHDLRHFYASTLIAAGRSVKVVAERLGNSPTVCLTTYAHLWPSDDELDRKAIDDVFAVVPRLRPAKGSLA